MMTTALLLACAALCAFAAEFSWKELTNEIMVTIDNLRNQEDIFVKDLKVNGQLKCEHAIFCQAEKELREKVSGKKFEHLHTVKKIIRILHNVTEHHVNTCKPFGKKDEIPLREFMEGLKRCVQKEYGKTHK